MNSDGSADGQRSFRNVWRAVAPIDRIRVIASGSTRPNPSSSAMATGKNVTSTTMRTLGSNPNPNQITNSGAIATIGIVWLVTSSGSTARRTGAQRSSATATPIASVTDSAHPTSASTSVGTRLPTAASRASHSELRTRVGAGSVIGSSDATRT